MSRSRVLFPHLDRVLTRQRRQMLADLALASLVGLGLVAMFAA